MALGWWEQQVLKGGGQVPGPVGAFFNTLTAADRFSNSEYMNPPIGEVGPAPGSFLGGLFSGIGKSYKDAAGPSRHSTNKVGQNALDVLQPKRAQYESDIDFINNAQLPPYEAPPIGDVQSINELMRSAEVTRAVQAMLNSQNTPIRNQIGEVRRGLQNDLKTLAWLDTVHTGNANKMIEGQKVRNEESGKKLSTQQADARQAYNSSLEKVVDQDAGMLDESAYADVEAHRQVGAADQRVQQDELAQFESERQASGLDYMNQVLAASQMQTAQDQSRVQRDAGADIRQLNSQITANSQAAPAMSMELASQLHGQSQADQAMELERWAAEQAYKQKALDFQLGQIGSRIQQYNNERTFGSAFPNQFDEAMAMKGLEGPDPSLIFDLIERRNATRKAGEKEDPKTGEKTFYYEPAIDEQSASWLDSYLQQLIQGGGM